MDKSILERLDEILHRYPNFPENPYDLLSICTIYDTRNALKIHKSKGDEAIRERAALIYREALERIRKDPKNLDEFVRCVRGLSGYYLLVKVGDVVAKGNDEKECFVEFFFVNELGKVDSVLKFVHNYSCEKNEDMDFVVRDHVESVCRRYDVEYRIE